MPEARQTRWGGLIPERLTWIVGFGTAVGYSNNALGGWLVAALTAKGGLDVERAAYVVATETFVMGLVMLAVSARMHRLPRKSMMIGALAGAIVAQGLTACASLFWQLAAARACSGAAFGILYSVAIANGAGGREPQRIFAGAAAIALVAGTGFNVAMGFGAGHGVTGLMLAEVAYCVVLSLPLLFMPFPAIVAVEAAPGGSQVKVPRSLMGIGVVTMMALLTIGTSGVLLFTVKIAAQVGIAAAALGPGLSIVSLVSALGGVIAARLGKRVGNAPPLVAGLALMGLCLFAFPRISSPAAFWILETLIVSLFWFISPYVFGLAVEVDGTGRLAAASGSMKTLIGAAGVAVGGVVAHRIGISSVGVLGLFTCLIAAVLAVVVVRALTRRDASVPMTAAA